MLPPVLEIFVLWHPEDHAGESLARGLIDHFHGTAYSGLIGGAIEIYPRSAPWGVPGSAPRPIAGVADAGSESDAAALTVVVPVMGVELTRVIEREDSTWTPYIDGIVAAAERSPESVLIVPAYVAAEGSAEGTRLNQKLGGIQMANLPIDETYDGIDSGRLARDIGQAVVQKLRGTCSRLSIFVSHTKRVDSASRDAHFALLDRVRAVIGKTRLEHFFDANSLQPGADWAAVLEQHASRGALLVVRTDLYSSRQWCQREVRIAKQARVPVVILDALEVGDDRGSFLMDHVPRIPSGGRGLDADDRTVTRVLDQLVDECLKRALWDKQERLAKDHGFEIAWWAAHAPEPLTFARWLREAVAHESLPDAGPIRVLHPDPPLGPDELEVLSDIASLTGVEDRLEVLTPRGLAARGG